MITDDLTEFRSFPKIPRLFKPVTITEKLDGTNGCVVITDDGLVRPASRNKWITPGDDNFGFAKWVAENTEQLVGLGVGRHWGEWWGSGIQRGYDLSEKRFSLFDIFRWTDENLPPACCHRVPVLAVCGFNSELIANALCRLGQSGSVAAPGYNRPEGIVIRHSASRLSYKHTFFGDDKTLTVEV